MASESSELNALGCSGSAALCLLGLLIAVVVRAREERAAILCANIPEASLGSLCSSVDGAVGSAPWAGPRFETI